MGWLEQMGLRLAQLHVKQGHICHQKKKKLVKKMKIWYQCCDDKQYKIEARKKPEAHFQEKTENIVNNVLAFSSRASLHKNKRS